MNKFRVKTYEFTSDKIQNKDKVTFAFLTDLHGLEYGNCNSDLCREIEMQSPDAILVAGDMVVRTEPESLKTAFHLLRMLSIKFPVFYALGNHEFKMKRGIYSEDYRKYEQDLKEAGICFLHNEYCQIELKGNTFVLYGLELPMEYYRKPCSPKLTVKEMKTFLGIPRKQGYQILLAHNPKYGKAYLQWGADLILSGHYHGGIIRLTEHHGLTCPQYLLFPPFCCGDFSKGKSKMLVSAGLGEHTIPVRIHNPRELLMIHINGKRSDS